MNSSGIKRGLAATAISALAVAGLPFLASSASADSINDQVGAGAVELYSQYSGAASVQNDGVNTTVHLLAGGGPDVSQVRFEYGPVGSATVIDTVSRTNGAFSTEWAPPASIFGTTVDVRAVGLSSVGTPIAGATDVQSTAVGANVPAVDIANAAGSTVGIFPQPYGLEEPEIVATPFNGVSHDTAPAIINGTTSGAAAVELSDLSTGSRIFPAAAANPVPSAPNANGIRTFKGTANFSDYVLDATAPIVNEAIVGARQIGGSDDAEVLNLRRQTITTVTAVATPASVPNSGTSTAVVTVTDQFGEPLSGAQVIFDADKDNVWDTDEMEGYTNANGQVSFAGLTGSAAGTTYDFFVNTTDGNDFEPALDFKRSVTVTSFAQVATTLTSTSADGNAFDVNENDADDLQAKVVDQNGTGIAGQVVSYSLSLAPFATTPPTATPPPATGTAVTGADGVANIPFTNLGNGTYTLKTFVEQDGTPGQSSGDLSGADLVFKAGDSTLAFVDAPSATAIAGTTDTFDATLKLQDGTALPGRLVTFTYTPSGNVVVAATANQPAGTTRVSDTQATDTTDANGVVSVALADPATPAQAELNGVLDADTSTNDIGNAAEDAADLDVDFVSNTPPANSTVTITTDNNVLTPGEANGGSVTVLRDPDITNDPAINDRVPVVGLAVTLTVDKGFFTNGAPENAPVIGADAGDLKSTGTSITVVTDANGVATYSTAIERDAGFDDDGLVEATVTATAGSVSDTEDYDYSSSNPLNGGDVFLTQVPDAQQDNPVDPTRVGDQVAYDVKVTDQFGNVVGGELVTLSDDSANAGVTGAVTSDFDAAADAFLTGFEAETVNVTATWTTDTFKFTTNTGGGNPAPGAPETLTDTASAEFYEVSFADSTFELSGNPETTAPVGSAVTETLTALDQEGNPIAGLDVEFTRTGPGAENGGVVRTTNANGEASFTFFGNSAGVSQIVANISNGSEDATVTDTVRFGAVDSGPVEIIALLTGDNNGPADDRIKVETKPKADGAKVRLFTRVTGTSPRILLATKTLNANGAANFVMNDDNGRRATRYFAIVSRTNDTLADRTNSRFIR